ncbi:hypothetical protein KM92DES2_20003 [uncultured Desulfovibrio sp.]|uniref:Uncharacterized protein n=1 Tax=uncultured Desulfovibrio sp. TaxID=167968 RepID=A0A212KI04_9BACT|nr:hypothetical protein KM92DES2_20003 [uncultured Desulfovibrio sp.]
MQEKFAWKPLAAAWWSIPIYLNGNQTDAGTLSPEASCDGTVFCLMNQLVSCFWQEPAQSARADLPLCGNWPQCITAK